MTTLARVAILLATVAMLNSWSPPVSAAESTCKEIVNMYSVTIVCEYDGASLQDAQAATPQSEWVVYQLCRDGTSGGVEACSNPRVCTIDGRVGTLYAVFKDGARVGTACLTANEATDVDKPPIRTLVIRSFEELDWPASALTVQPPGGKTLVNLETNFFTSNVDITSITVRLQGKSVIVTASPIAYRWHFGDGMTVTTESPGAPYPDLDVAHVYRTTDEVLVSVDTQYGDASFTVDGGPSEDIPSTIWVAGAPQDLQVVEALPQLVLR